MAEGITLLDITFEPTKGINKVIKDCYEALKCGLKKAQAKMYHAFKVIGENRLVVVAEGDVDLALYEMNEEHGDKIRITSIPVRNYFSFSEKALDVPKDMIPTEIKDLTPGGNIYYMSASLDYKGITIESLKDTWRREAMALLPAMKANQLEVSLFKPVYQRGIHLFIKRDVDEADDAVWTLPIWKEMGNQISSVCKPIKHMEP